MLLSIKWLHVGKQFLQKKNLTMKEQVKVDL